MHLADFAPCTDSNPCSIFFEPCFPLFQENSILSQSSVQVENLCAFLYRIYGRKTGSAVRYCSAVADSFFASLAGDGGSRVVRSGCRCRSRRGSKIRIAGGPFVGGIPAAVLLGSFGKGFDLDIGTVAVDDVYLRAFRHVFVNPVCVADTELNAAAC